MTIELSKHWKDRYKLEEKHRAKTDEELERKLDAIYKQHISEIKKEIDSFWQKYADKNGITKQEAKKRADKLDMDVVSHKAGQLVARAEKMRKRGKKVINKDFTKAENDLMKLYNLKMKTSRLEVLQANLKLHQYELAMNEWEATERHLIEAIRRENFYSSGILKETLGSYQTAKTSAETIAYANFHGASWSERIWERQDALREIVRKSVADTIVRGKGTQLLIRQLEKEFKVSNAYARRLAITETARVYSEAQKANYKANDFERYEVLAESGACGICKPLDGEDYPVDRMTPGRNAPPFHPNCKCTTVPYLESEKSVDKADEKVYNQDVEGMYRKKVIDQTKMSIASQEQINRLSRKFRRRGGEFIDDNDAIAYLDDKKAVAITLDAYTILKRKEISISALIEELEHAEQYLRNENDGSALSVAINEVNAKRKSISERKRYKLPKIEVDSVRDDIKFYEKEIERLNNENSKF